MKRFLIILLSLILGAPFMSAQNYYCRKGLEYYNMEWYDSAFRTFVDGMNHGEINSTYYVIYCYLREEGTPRDLAKAEALMQKYAQKDPDICILTANYYGGFITKAGYETVIYWREWYGDRKRKTDPSLALKYAHYYLDHWDKNVGVHYQWSASIDAFRIIMDYEIAGQINGKYGFKKNMDKAVDEYKKWIGRETISGYDNTAYVLNSTPDEWFKCLFKQVMFYATDTQDFLDKYHVLEKKGVVQTVRSTMLWDSYPGTRPYRHVNVPGAKTLVDHVRSATSTAQLSEIRRIKETVFPQSILDGFSTEYTRKMTELAAQEAAAKAEMAAKEAAANEAAAEEWWETHQDDVDLTAQFVSFREQSPAVRTLIEKYFEERANETIEDTDYEEGLLELREHPLVTPTIRKSIDDKIQMIRDREWSAGQFDVLSRSESVPDLIEFIKNPRTTRLYKENAQILLDSLLVVKRGERSERIESLTALFRQSDGTRMVSNEEMVLGNPSLESFREVFKDFRKDFDLLKAGIEATDREYPYLDPSDVSGLDTEFYDQLAMADIILKEDAGTVRPEDFLSLMNHSQDYHPLYLRDGYAISLANQLTAASSKSEIQAVKDLPVSPAAKKMIKTLTKKSYLRNKKQTLLQI